jgi:hypothetical protein
MAQQRFQSQGEDVLLHSTTLAGTPPPGERIEPVVAPVEDEETEAGRSAPPAREHVELIRRDAPAPVDTAPTVGLPGQVDQEIEFVVRLELAEPRSAEVVSHSLGAGRALEKPTQWLGRGASGEWQDVFGSRPAAEFQVVCGTLQLADRSGPVTPETLNAFVTLTQQAAEELMAVAQLPEKHAALQTAQALDEFCADVDVLVGVNVVATGQDQFPGTKVRALAEASGLKLASDGTFQYRDDRGVVLYSLTNHESAPFSADDIKQFSTHGITFLFDVPKVANGVRGFDQMILVARQFADSLKGTMVDDNLKTLSDEGVGKIRQQLSAIYAKMDARRVPAGGRRALRLFS